MSKKPLCTLRLNNNYQITFIMLCKELDHSFKLLGKDLYNLF